VFVERNWSSVQKNVTKKKIAKKIGLSALREEALTLPSSSNKCTIFCIVLFGMQAYGRLQLNHRSI